MAMQKASMWYDKMNKTVGSTLPQQQNDEELFIQQQQQKIPFFIALIQAHQRLAGTPGAKVIRSQACQTNAHLLLDESTIQVMIPNCTNTLYADIMKSCYQLALQQALELVAADNAPEEEVKNDQRMRTSAAMKSTSSVDLLTNMTKSLEFLKFILDQGIGVTSNIMNVAAKSYHPNVSLSLILLDPDKASAL